MTPGQFAAAAESLLGAPFRLGGRDPATGVDCVGLVACALRAEAPEGYALRNSGIERHLAFVARAGFVPAAGPLAPGDLILARPGPARMGDLPPDAGPIWVQPWDLGYNPHSAVDRAIMATREAVFPHWGLDPWYD